MSDPYSFGHVTLIRTTDKALLVQDEDLNETWVPKSVIDDDSEVYSDKTTEGDLIVAGWWAKANGFW